jgi:hypothetical protein
MKWSWGLVEDDELPSNNQGKDLKIHEGLPVNRVEWPQM